MFLIAQLLTTVINIVIFLIFAQIVVFWLVAFEVLKVNNFQARHLVETMNRFAEKLYRPVRRVIPPIAGIDLSPVVVIIGLQVLQSIIWQVLG